jgi:hypothetical protein
MTVANTIEPIPTDWQKRPIIRQYNAEGHLVVRTYGKTAAELLEDHRNGECGMYCEYCYAHAMLTTGYPFAI